MSATPEPQPITADDVAAILAPVNTAANRLSAWLERPVYDDVQAEADAVALYEADPDEDERP